jgi:hypothetical protein
VLGQVERLIMKRHIRWPIRDLVFFKFEISVVDGMQISPNNILFWLHGVFKKVSNGFMTKHCHANLHEHIYNKDIIVYLYVFGKACTWKGTSCGR